MHVVVGPVPSASVLAWVHYAEGVLSPDSAGAAAGGDMPADTAGSFRAYIAQWQEEASRGAEFHWEADVPSEVAEYLVLAFYRIVQQLAEAAEARGMPLSPPEGETFYVMLVQGLLDALADEGPAAAEFAEDLRSFWPGLES